MAILMRIDASAGGERSVSRRLGDHFEEHWRENRPGSHVSVCDLLQTPPPPMSESFIAAAYTPPDRLDDLGRTVLAYSDRALRALVDADALLITTPMYNFGLPGVLKAWFDQIIRIGVSFGTTDDPGQPYVPLLQDKPVVVITARGSSDMIEGGTMAELDFLTPQMRTLLAFIGFSHPAFFDICGTEGPPEEWARQFDQIKLALETAAERDERPDKFQERSKLTTV